MHEDLAFPEYAKVDEIPFDFSRKVMSVVVQTPDKVHRLICKGAPEEVFKRCRSFDLEGKMYPMDHMITTDLKEEFDQLSADGFRVLALAYRDLEPKPAYSKDDEKDLILRGYVAFLDPPKDTRPFRDCRPARARHRGQGAHGGQRAGEPQDLPGSGHRHRSGAAGQAGRSACPTMRAGRRRPTRPRCSPGCRRPTSSGSSKPCKRAGHVVGFLGDGINDAPALRAADVGISVDTAVDIAKESADTILLEKDLLVLEEGVLEGRKVFANILKYIRMGASSNFGNMFSVLGASIFLPFLPMAPIQILTNNLLYDFSQVPIPTDDVDPEQIAKPRPWSMSAISRFILFIGPCSSVFDYTTFFIMLYVFGCWSIPGVGVTVPDRLVCRIAADADAHHPRHSHQPNSVPAKLGQLAVDCDHRSYHDGGNLAAILPSGAGFTFHRTTVAVLAPGLADVAWLCPADTGGQDLALAERLDCAIAAAVDVSSLPSTKKGRGEQLNRGKGLCLMQAKKSVVMEFHVSRHVRDKYQLSDTLFSLTGNVIFAGFHAARLLAQKMNDLRDLGRFPEQTVKPGHINTMGLIDEILHYVAGLYREQKNPEVMGQALAWLGERFRAHGRGRNPPPFRERVPSRPCLQGRSER